MKALEEVLENRKLVKKDKFNHIDSKFLLYIPKEDRSPQLFSILIKKHYNLAKSVAAKEWKKYHGKINNVIDYDDLEAVALYGLYLAIKKFDIRFHTEFSTYALHWVRQVVKREIMNNIGQARIPVHFHEKIRKFNNLGSKSSEEKNLINKIKFQFLHNTSIEGIVNEDNEQQNEKPSTKIPYLPSNYQKYYDPEFQLLNNDVHERIIFAIKKVTKKRNFNLVLMRFGLNDFGEEHTLEDVGVYYGLTRERVRQICSKCIEKLKYCKYLNANDFEIYYT